MSLSPLLTHKLMIILINLWIFTVINLSIHWYVTIWSDRICSGRLSIERVQKLKRNPPVMWRADRNFDNPIFSSAIISTILLIFCLSRLIGIRVFVDHRETHRWSPTIGSGLFANKIPCKWLTIGKVDSLYRAFPSRDGCCSLGGTERLCDEAQRTFVGRPAPNKCCNLTFGAPTASECCDRKGKRRSRLKCSHSMFVC